MAAAATASYPSLALSIAYIEGGKIDRLHFGDINIPQDNTIYEIGEVTKVFTGVLLTSDLGFGQIKVEDPVTSWLPKDVDATGFPQDITLFTLATSTAGLPEEPPNLTVPLDDPAAPRLNPYGAYSKKLLSEFISSYKPDPDVPVGTYQQSMLGYGLLGYALTYAKNASYDQLLKRIITGPLQMIDTVVNLTPEQQGRVLPEYLGMNRTLLDSTARGSSVNTYQSEVVPLMQWQHQTLVGAEGLKSSLNDMVMFARANLAAGGYDQAATLVRLVTVACFKEACQYTCCTFSEFTPPRTGLDCLLKSRANE
jgi:serine-type D-Ala-D-Ala carboxypeptidase/endopeptidase